LPAVGASLLWAPIAVYFLATGAVAKGLVLIGFGVVVLTVVDNTLRPLLVGKDTQLPSYLVLVSTLGGIAAFGISGLIIGPVVAATLIALWDLFSGLSAPPRAGAEDRVSRLPGRRHAPGPRDSRPTRD
jgi:predicted PurR-regulated permease PerM